MFNNIAITLVGIIVTLSFILCCRVLTLMWQRKASSRFKAFFYRCCWNEAFINLFTLVFFLTTMYTRFFPVTFDFYIYLNRFPWWTKFAQITQEHLVYIQTMSVFLTVGGRYCTVCLLHSELTLIVEGLKHWEILMLQLFLPTLTVIPLYYLYDQQYVFEKSIPLFLNAIDGSYDKVIIYIALLYRSTSLALSFFAYILMFWTIRKKATYCSNRNETTILIHGGCLLAALGAALACAVIKDFRIGADYMIMRLFYYTTIMWVPCTNIVTTFCIVASLLKRIKPLNATMTTVTKVAGRNSAVAVIH